MSNILLAQAVKFLAELLLGSDVFNHIIGVVQRWDAKEISGVEKKKGVLAEFEVLGLNLTESFANLGIELAVAYVGYKAGSNMEPTKANVISAVENTAINTLANTVQSSANTN